MFNKLAALAIVAATAGQVTASCSPELVNNWTFEGFTSNSCGGTSDVFYADLGTGECTCRDLSLTGNKLHSYWFQAESSKFGFTLFYDTGCTGSVSQDELFGNHEATSTNSDVLASSSVRICRNS
ncbi:hypothetical protein HYDPIDRAFT_26451 [Hydnomerulius pinastri MD-312]|nr:hypothetical protein HYDPIDRAFT_26451 [Hydnomerulius pinastri MD-312]